MDYRLSPEIIGEFHRVQTQYPNQEMGWGLKITPTGELHIVKFYEGKEKSVLFTERHPIEVHTHPEGLYGKLRYHPPTQTDYRRGLLASFHSLQWDIVVDANGLWLYRPNQALIDYVLKVQPDIVEQAQNAKFVPGRGFSFTINDDLYEVLKTIESNTSTDGIALSQPPAIINEILVSYAGQLLASFLPITVKEYIKRMAYCVDGVQAGFEVHYYRTAIFIPVAEEGALV